MRSKKLTFTNKEGEKISAELDLPLDERPLAYALFAHCFTCSKNLLTVKRISASLTQKGIAVFRFDFTGLGQSEGDFSETNFSSNISDLLAASTYMSRHFEAPEILIGHSLGGAAVIHSARHMPHVKALVTIAAPFEPAHVSHMFENQLEELRTKGEAEVSVGGRSFTLRNQFLEDISSKSTQALIPELDKALLVFHSPQDKIVAIDQAAKIYTAARHPKSFVSLDGADHLIRKKEDAEYVGEVIASWVKRYLLLDKKKNFKALSHVAVRNTENLFTTEIMAGEHFLLADEPEEYGGFDSGPAPYELLLSALGACTVMTLNMYAKRKQWNLGAFEVHLSHARSYEEDVQSCEKEMAHISKIERIFKFDKTLDEGMRTRLLEIADKCPVHKTLSGRIQVVSKSLEE